MEGSEWSYYSPFSLVPFCHVAKPRVRKKREREGMEMGEDERRREKQREERYGKERRGGDEKRGNTALMLSSFWGETSKSSLELCFFHKLPRALAHPRPSLTLTPSPQGQALREALGYFL